MTTLRVHPQRTPLAGSVTVAADVETGHRALLLGALSNGRSEIRGLSGATDHATLLACLGALGVAFTLQPQPRGSSSATFRGVGLFGLQAPTNLIACGASSSVLGLLAGLLAAQPFASSLVGVGAETEQLAELQTLLGSRGAQLELRSAAHAGSSDLSSAVSLEFAGSDATKLGPISYAATVPSARTKSALLMSGLFAHGTTEVREPLASPDHTERILAHHGVPLRAAAGLVELDPAGWSGQISAFSTEIPGDFSSAAMLAAAAMLVPDSRVEVRRVGINPTRIGMLEWCRDAGLALAVEHRGEEAAEPLGNLHAGGGGGRGHSLAGELLLRSAAELPIIAALAAGCRGSTTLAVGNLVEQNAQLPAIARMLRAFGVECTQVADALQIEGVGAAAVRAGEFDGGHDPHLAMAATILALRAADVSRVHNASAITRVFPRFVATLRGLGARIEVLAPSASSSALTAGTRHA